MGEEFLHFIWKHRFFKSDFIYSQTGDQIQIIDVGEHNSNAGPDFFDARIKINGTLWAGNVEIHLKASHWNRHGHQNDKAYENVILHVVAEDDEQIKSPAGRSIPCVVLDYPDELTIQYKSLLRSQKWIPCEDEFFKVDRFFVHSWLDRMLVERLERKAQEIQLALTHNKNSWDETFYHYLARHMGMKVNGDPFEQMARSLPLKYLDRQKDSLFQVEALLFGQAGMFGQSLLGDDYYMKLKEEYHFLSAKYSLKPMEVTCWKYLRLRPNNFPPIRISQFAALIHGTRNLFSKIIETTNLDQLRSLFMVKASPYWDSHFQFNKESAYSVPKVLGDSTLNVILINAVIPFLFVYGLVHEKYDLRDRALDFMDKIPAENNSVIQHWKNLGVDVKSAFHTQGLLQLKTDYCDARRCLECELGNRILGSVIPAKDNY